MKQSTASKTLLAIITILTVMMALIVPSPVYAKELPPPPPPPANDTGGKGHGSSSHSSSKDLPADTTLVVTNNGTPMSLAAQLTVNVLNAPSVVATNYVKFCKSDNTDVVAGDCTSYKSIQTAIDAVAKIKNADASGIFYVDLGYATPLPNVTKFIPIVLDQSKFSAPNVNGTLNLQMLGGYNFGTGTQGGATSLIQSFNIKKINDQSSFYMENFVFNVDSLLQDGISVTDSNHVTLKNITVNDTAVGGNGINIENSNDVALDTVNVNRSGGLAGDGISIKNSGSLTLEDVSTTNTNPLFGDGLQITGSQNIHMDNVSATSTNMYGAYLKDNSGGLVIDNSAFNNSGNAGLYVTGQNGPVLLNNVAADNNGKNVADTTLLPLKYMFPDLASGAAFVNNSGSLIINDSQFIGNATAGLWIQNQSGNAPVGDALAEMSANNSVVLLNHVDAYGNGISPYTHSVPIIGTIFDNLGWSGGAFIDNDSGSVVVNDSNFSGNFGAGLEAYATRGNIILKNVNATSNTGDGAVLNTVLDLTDGLDIGTGSIIITGDENGGQTFGGGPQLWSQFSGNGKSGLVTLGGGYTGVFNTLVNGNRSTGAFLNGLGLIGLFGDEFVGNDGNGLNANAGLGLRVNNSLFLGNDGNGLSGLSLGNVNLENSSFIQNHENGAAVVSVLGGINAENDDFVGNGENGLTATSLGDIYLADVNAGANRENGAMLTSVLGDVNVFSGAFGNTSGGFNDAGANTIARTKGNGENGLVINTLAGDVTLGMENEQATLNNNHIGVVDANQNGANGIVVNTHFGDIYAQNVFADHNDILGAMLHSADGTVNVRDSSFDNNGVGGLLGLSLRGIMLGDVDASGNGLFGAATLSAGRTGIFDSTFDNNGGVGLLSVGLGPILVNNVEANNNGLLGAGLVSVGSDNKFEDFAKKDDRSCSGRPGDVCVDQMTADGNGFIGAAMLGTNTVDVENSLFTGNDDLGSLGGVIPGGGLVAIGGESTVLDQVQANNNFGFGAVVGNTGGVYDLLTNLIDDTNYTASAINQAVGGPTTTLDLGGVPVINNAGNVSIRHSDFANNDGFGLLSISDGDITMHDVIANNNGSFGAAVLAEGDVDVSFSHFNNNGEFGLYVSIFSPEAGLLKNTTTHTVTLDNVSADNNETWGAFVQANTSDNVDVSVTDSHFNGNEGEAYFGLGIDTTGDVFVKHVVGDNNAGDGADISGKTVTIRKSHFNFNDKLGLVVSSLAATITHTNVCWNKIGPDNVTTTSLFTDDFHETCTNEDNGGTTVETTQPWQTIKVMVDPGKNVGTLSCKFGTTFLYMEKQTSPTPDFEWARAVMSPCIVADGSVGTFLDLNEGALPGALPAGFTYQGKAFDLSITGPNGQAIDTLGGPMMVRFTLPEGFTLPAGKKLDILWFDPSANKWVELTTYNSASYAWAFAANDGTFVLTIK